MLAQATEKAADGNLALPGALYWRQRATDLRASADAQMKHLPPGGNAFVDALADVRTKREQALFFDALATNAERRGE